MTNTGGKPGPPPPTTEMAARIRPYGEKIWQSVQGLLDNTSPDARELFIKLITQYVATRKFELVFYVVEDAERLEDLAHKARELRVSLFEAMDGNESGRWPPALFMLSNLMQKPAWASTQAVDVLETLTLLEQGARETAADIRSWRTGKGRKRQNIKRWFLLCAARFWSVAGLGRGHTSNSKFLDFLVAIDQALVRVIAPEFNLGTRESMATMLRRMAKRTS